VLVVAMIVLCKLCQPWRAEVLTVGLPGPMRCHACGELAIKQGNGFDAYSVDTLVDLIRKGRRGELESAAPVPTRELRLLTVAEVEDAIVDAIECMTDYQCYNWAPVSAALKHIGAVAEARRTLAPEPEKNWPEGDE
jgi:hypothetical protein